MMKHYNLPLEIVLKRLDQLREELVKAGERGEEFDVSMQIHTIPQEEDHLILGSTVSFTMRLKGAQIQEGE